MATLFSPGLTAERVATIRRVRELPIKGEICVRVGDIVSARTIVARANLPGDLTIVRIAERLGIHPTEVIRGLKVKEGEQVREGQILCEHAGLFGLFKSTLSAPHPGTVEFITPRTGHVGIRAASKPIELSAYTGGRVVEIQEQSAVTLEVTSTFIQGIFGVGGEKQGTIRLLPITTDTPVTEAHIPQECTGAILVGGMRPDIGALRAAAARGAVGFITGSIDDTALAAYLGYDVGIALTGDEDISMTLIITEGFGALSLSAHVHALLREHEGKSASLNGATQVRAGAVRPEIIIPLDVEQRSDSVVASVPLLELGRKIRITRVPYFGVHAVITGLPHELIRIPTGSYARVLKARLADGQEVVVPRANVEILS